MTTYIFRLPDIGEGTAEAELVAWHVKLGETVEEDQPLADVMTDKATVEITSPISGTIRALHGAVGMPSQVGSPFVEFDAIVADSADPAINAPTEKAPAQPLAASSAIVSSGSAALPVNRPKASPAVRRRAQEAGVALELLQASGPHGRIRQADLDAYLAQRQVPSRRESAPPPAPFDSSTGDFREVKLAGLRRKIAQKMEISSRTIPHFSYVEEVDVTELERTRAMLNAHYGDKRPKLSFLPFFILELCRTLPKYSQINATYDEASGMVRHYAPVHIGIATQTDNGLIVPVLRNAQRLGLWELAAEIARLASATRDGTAKREELSGSTITLTSLGMLGGVATTPVINHPEVAIIGPNRIIERPVAVGGAVVLRKMMNISASFDHRVVDGYDAAQFIQDLRTALESPALLLAR